MLRSLPSNSGANVHSVLEQGREVVWTLQRDAGGGHSCAKASAEKWFTEPFQYDAQNYFLISHYFYFLSNNTHFFRYVTLIQKNVVPTHTHVW